MKIRKSFVTNSSSSSFILAFKNKKEAFFEVCEAFLRYKKEECGEKSEDKLDSNSFYLRFDEDSGALDNIIYALNKNQVSVEDAIKYYIDSVSWYPIRTTIRDEMYQDTVNYPREDAQDFNERYKDLIEEKSKLKIEEVKAELQEWLKGKKYVSILEIEDHYPEREAYEVCSSIDSKYQKKC